VKRNRWSTLSTEQRNPRSKNLDRLPTRKIVDLMLDEDRRAIEATRKCATAIAQAATLVADAIEKGGRILFVGAGTSGRLGILEAAECPPTFGIDRRTIEAAIAGGPHAVFVAREGGEDDVDAGQTIASRLTPRDVLVGISASSVTPYVASALAAGRRWRVKTILITCARPTASQKAPADIVIRAVTGPEVLTGSTRLKAGSATKAILNALTTAAMVRLGKTYENLMVDHKLTSAKLRDRARRAVATAGRVDDAEADRLLDAAGGETKTAIVMARLGISAREARQRLGAAKGHLRKALPR
jgi:N-acetylmuramic acid 6-phosphate etherase